MLFVVFELVQSMRRAGLTQDREHSNALANA
jgi:hypothetical protein